jgi:PAS domain S-box-containing protein
MRLTNSSFFRWFRNVSIKEKLYFVMCIMAFLIIAELVILYFTIHALSSTRAFVGGEGLYSKSQKEAVYSLIKYATTKNESDYRAFQKFLRIPQGDGQARLELEKKEPDEERAAKYFLQARNHPDDIPGMIQLFRRFRHVSYIDKAVSYWAKGDSLIGLLNETGARMHVLLSLKIAAPVEMSQLNDKIDSLNGALTILEDEFSFTLGEGSRWMENLILKILFLVALTVELTGLILTISVTTGISRGLDELIRATGQVGRADWTGRALIRSQDELGKLGTSFNRMMDDLQSITENQKLAEETLRKQKDLYETLVFAQSEMGEGVIITEEDSIVFANEALSRLYGFSIPEMLAFPSYFVLIPPEEMLRMKTIQHDRMSGSDVPQTGETSILRKDGKIIQISYSRKFVKDGNRTQLISIIRDITDQKANEKKLEEMAAIVHASDDAIKTISLNGIVLNWNKGAEQLYGYTATEMIGRHISLLSVPGMEDEFALLTSHVRNQERMDPYESVRKQKNGQLIDVSTTASPILDKEGQAVSIAIISRDISEGKRAATALQIKSDELKRSNTELEQFAYAISHDLGEPLRTMSSYIQLLERRYPDKLDKDAHDFIRFAVNGAHRMNSLINDLLSYSRLGHSELSVESVAVNDLVDVIQVDLRDQISTRNACISYTALPVVQANKAQLAQLFQNLIGNAIKFNTSLSPRVDISARKIEKGWFFSVKDNGIGIDKKFASRIFTIFQRLHTSEEYEGTGIGLALCKKIVEKHGGEIWVESQPGEGCTFCFTLR